MLYYLLIDLLFIENWTVPIKHLTSNLTKHAMFIVYIFWPNDKKTINTSWFKDNPTPPISLANLSCVGVLT